MTEIAEHKADVKLGQKYEVIFSVFLVLLAFLWKENPNFIYPQILYAFIIFLALNLSAGLALKFWPSHEWVSALIILANCGTITAILSYSGGQNSYLWVLYLLPVYTVCLLLTGREVAWITTGVISFNSIFYASSTLYWNEAIVFELVLKNGFLVFAAFVTWKIAQMSRFSREELKVQKNKQAGLENKVKIQEIHLEHTEKMAEVGMVGSGISYDLQNHLALIMADSQMLLRENFPNPATKKTVKNINRLARTALVTASNLGELAKNKEFIKGPADINEIIKMTLVSFEKMLSQNYISVRNDLAEPLAKIQVSHPHLQRFFLTLFSNALGCLKGGGTLFIKTEPIQQNKLNHIQVKVDMELAKRGSAKSALFSQKDMEAGFFLCQEIAMKHNGGFQLERNSGSGYRITTSFPCHTSSAVAA